jgi:fatty-acyl-CoA synthase
MAELPLTATGKITKASLRRAAWQCDDPVFWAPDRDLFGYRPMTDADRAGLARDFDLYGRSALVPR